MKRGIDRFHGLDGRSLFPRSRHPLPRRDTGIPQDLLLEVAAKRAVRSPNWGRIVLFSILVFALSWGLGFLLGG